MRLLEYMGFVLAVFPLKYGFIIVQIAIYVYQLLLAGCFRGRVQESISHIFVTERAAVSRYQSIKIRNLEIQHLNELM